MTTKPEKLDILIYRILENETFDIPEFGVLVIFSFRIFTDPPPPPRGGGSVKILFIRRLGGVKLS